MSDATKWKAEVHDDGLTWGVYDADGEPIVWEAGGCDKTAALQIVTDHNEAQGLKARIVQLENKLARAGAKLENLPGMNAEESALVREHRAELAEDGTPS
ncbi:MAG: hypothetical protein QGD90_00970 [Candidatus Hydrogenedentes bacterium]|nr:hypothetical protein [Candidatus Hydrogenedentota bacterium]